jgi:hypothetical protein
MNAINKGVTHISAAFLFAILAGGCAMDEGGTPIPPAVRDAIDDEPAQLMIDTANSKAYADGRVVALESGSIVLSMGHHEKLGIDSLDVQLGTMIVAGESPYLDGIELRNVRVSLYAPQEVEVTWTASGEAGFAHLVADLALDWDIVASNGQQAGLARQRLKDVEIELDVFSSMDGSLTAMIHGSRPGVIWDWAGLADIRDIRFDVRAESVVP